MRRRDIAKGLVSLCGPGLLARRVAAQSRSPPDYGRTPVERLLRVTPVDYAYPAGHVYRYGTNPMPGKTDMTSSINAAANVCRKGNYPLQLPPESMLVSASLDFSGIYVEGLGNPFGGPSLIQANSDQFDVVTTTGLSTFYNFNVDGGNPHHTPRLAGNNFSLKATTPAHPYLVSFMHVGSTNAKRDQCYIERGGYTSFFHFHGLGAGSHGLECLGLSTDECTTIRDYGGSQFSTTPHGFGIKLTEVVACAFRDTILEQTWGIQLNGADNRALTFDGVYQEVTIGSKFTGSISGTALAVSRVANGFISVGQLVSGAGVAPNTFITAADTGTGGAGTYTVNNSQTVTRQAMIGGPVFLSDINSAGIGLTMRGCYGGDIYTAPLANWENVYYQGNANLQENAIPLAKRIFTNSSGQQVISSTSDVTVGQLTLNAGTYRLSGAVQIILSSGVGNVTQLACQITTNASASGVANSTSSFIEGAAQTQSFGTTQDGRISCSTQVQVTSPTTYYLRARIALAGSIDEAYNGILRAELIE